MLEFFVAVKKEAVEKFQNIKLHFLPNYLNESFDNTNFVFEADWKLDSSDEIHANFYTLISKLIEKTKPNSKILIKGNKKYGKSFFMKYLWSLWAKNELPQHESKYFYIDLMLIEDMNNLENIFIEQTFKNIDNNSKKILLKLLENLLKLENGRNIIILDHIEIFQNNQQQLINLINNYPHCQFILVSSNNDNENMVLDLDEIVTLLGYNSIQLNIFLKKIFNIEFLNSNENSIRKFYSKIFDKPEYLRENYFCNKTNEIYPINKSEEFFSLITDYENRLKREIFIDSIYEHDYYASIFFRQEIIKFSLENLYSLENENCCSFFKNRFQNIERIQEIIIQLNIEEISFKNNKIVIDYIDDEKIEKLCIELVKLCNNLIYYSKRNKNVNNISNNKIIIKFIDIRVKIFFDSLKHLINYKNINLSTINSGLNYFYLLKYIGGFDENCFTDTFQEFQKFFINFQKCYENEIFNPYLLKIFKYFNDRLRNHIFLYLLENINELSLDYFINLLDIRDISLFNFNDLNYYLINKLKYHSKFIYKLTLQDDDICSNILSSFKQFKYLIHLHIVNIETSSYFYQYIEENLLNNLQSLYLINIDVDWEILAITGKYFFIIIKQKNIFLSLNN